MCTQERLSSFPKLYSLRIVPDYNKSCWLSSHALAQCPALTVVELCNSVSIESPGTFEEAVERLEDSTLQVLKFYIVMNSSAVRTQHSAACGAGYCSWGVEMARCMLCGSCYVGPLSVKSSSAQVLWMVQQNEQGRRGCVEILDSVRLRRCFSCTLEDSESGINLCPKVYVLRRRCTKDSIKQKWAPVEFHADRCSGVCPRSKPC